MISKEPHKIFREGKHKIIGLMVLSLLLFACSPDTTNLPPTRILTKTPLPTLVPQIPTLDWESNTNPSCTKEVVTNLPGLEFGSQPRNIPPHQVTVVEITPQKFPFEPPVRIVFLFPSLVQFVLTDTSPKNIKIERYKPEPGCKKQEIIASIIEPPIQIIEYNGTNVLPNIFRLQIPGPLRTPTPYYP